MGHIERTGDSEKMDKIERAHQRMDELLKDTRISGDDAAEVFNALDQKKAQLLPGGNNDLEILEELSSEGLLPVGTKDKILKVNREVSIETSPKKDVLKPPSFTEVLTNIRNTYDRFSESIEIGRPLRQFAGYCGLIGGAAIFIGGIDSTIVGVFVVANGELVREAAFGVGGLIVTASGSFIFNKSGEMLTKN